MGAHSRCERRMFEAGGAEKMLYVRTHMHCLLATHVAVGGTRVPDPVVGSRDPMRWFTGLGFTPFPLAGSVRSVWVIRSDRQELPMSAPVSGRFQSMRFIPNTMTSTDVRDTPLTDKVVHSSLTLVP